MVTLPKLRLAGFDARAPAEIPVPDNAMVNEGFDASEAIVTVPLALPLDCGTKVTVNVVLWLALSVSGVEIPLSWNPVPLTEACETSTLAVPMLVSVTICDCVDPTVILPKDSLVGLSASCPGASAAVVPVPVNETFVTVLDALLVTDSVALKAPAVLGEKLMETVALCPAATVTGRLGAVSEKYLVEMAALLTVIELLPVFVATTVMVLLLPAGTLPKSRSVVAKERILDCC